MTAIKPDELSLGIRDLLTILVPGAVLAFCLSPVYTRLFGRSLLFPEPRGEWGPVAVFLVSAYILGHLTEAVASRPLDFLYDRTYRNLRRLPSASQLGRWSRLRAAWRLNDADSCDVLRDTARRLQRDRLDGIGAARLAESSTPNLLDWAQSAVTMHAPVGAAEIESLQAASKFFRSMCLIALLVPLIGLSRGRPADPQAATDARATLVVAAILGVVASGAFARRFMKLRWAATQRTYEYFIESCLPAAGPVPQNGANVSRAAPHPGSAAVR